MIVQINNPAIATALSTEDRKWTSRSHWTSEGKWYCLADMDMNTLVDIYNQWGHDNNDEWVDIPADEDPDFIIEMFREDEAAVGMEVIEG